MYVILQVCRWGHQQWRGDCSCNKGWVPTTHSGKNGNKTECEPAFTHKMRGNITVEIELDHTPSYSLGASDHGQHIYLMSLAPVIGSGRMCDPVGTIERNLLFLGLLGERTAPFPPRPQFERIEYMLSWAQHLKPQIENHRECRASRWWKAKLWMQPGLPV